MTGDEFTVTTDDGVRLRVQRWPASRRDAPLVLGLHGLTANRLGFLPLLEELAGEVEFVAYDARGRGRSDKPAEAERYGHGRHAEDAATVLAEVGRPADVVVGQSMGAWHGLLLASRHPSLVGALVLADGGYFRDLPVDADLDAVLDEILGAGWLDRMEAVYPSREIVLAALQSAPPFRECWSPAVAELLTEGLEEGADGTVRNRCSALAAVTDARDYFLPREAPYVKAALAGVRCPAHLIRATRGLVVLPGVENPLLPQAAVEEFVRAVPQLTVETVPDTNHYTVNFARPGVVVIADAIRKALR